VTELAKTGVDYISIGALTHSAPSSDFSLKLLQDE
jgi:nicotinate-nucleotide pyrophosphorylase